MRCSYSMALILLLAACGGSDPPVDSRFDELREQSEAKEAEARAAAEDTPCEEDSQCSVLSFQPVTGACSPWTYKGYLVGAPTAAQAERLAAEQRALAGQASHFLPPSDIVCSAGIFPPAAPACLAGRCVNSP